MKRQQIYNPEHACLILQTSSSTVLFTLFGLYASVLCVRLKCWKVES